MNAPQGELNNDMLARSLPAPGYGLAANGTVGEDAVLRASTELLDCLVQVDVHLKCLFTASEKYTN